MAGARGSLLSESPLVPESPVGMPGMDDRAEHAHREVAVIGALAIAACLIQFLVLDVAFLVPSTAVALVLCSLSAHPRLFRRYPDLSALAFIGSGVVMLGAVTLWVGPLNSVFGLSGLLVASSALMFCTGVARQFGIASTLVIYAAKMYSEFGLGLVPERVPADALAPLSLGFFTAYAGYQLFGLAYMSGEVRASLERERRAAQTAVAANEAKSTFLANMSHEIRTPLNGVFGSLQVIDRVAEDPEQVRRYTSLAMSSYRSVLDIVNDILDMAKITEGKMTLVPEPTDLGFLVSEIVEEYRPLAEAKRLELDVQCSASSGGVYRSVDPTRVGQVLRNLLSNAIKFTESGGVTVHLDGHPAHDLVSIGIIDTGVGIPPEMLDLVFRPFDQVEPSRRGSRTGTGLGLSICRALVGMMGGKIEVESRIGVGTTFTFTLDAPASGPLRGAAKRETSARTLGTARVLVVEDAPVSAVVLEAMLKHGGHEVRLAENGKQAVAIALSEPVDIVLMDIHMPVMDGLQALSALQEAGFDRPMVACTANVLPEDVASYYEAGFVEVLGKPYLQEQISDVMRRQLSESSSRAPRT